MIISTSFQVPVRGPGRGSGRIFMPKLLLRFSAGNSAELAEAISRPAEFAVRSQLGSTTGLLSARAARSVNDCSKKMENKRTYFVSRDFSGGELSTVTLLPWSAGQAVSVMWQGRAAFTASSAGTTAASTSA